MQLDLKQVGSVTLLVSHSLLMPSCHFVYMQTYANPYSLSDLGLKVWWYHNSKNSVYEMT